MAVQVLQRRFYIVLMGFKEMLAMNKKNPVSRLILLISFSMLLPFAAQTSLAENAYMGFSSAFSHPSSGGDSDLENSLSLRLFVGVPLNSHVALELGYNKFHTEQDSREEDNVSQYRVEINSDDILLGIKGLVPLNKYLALYLSAGWLFWDTEFELEESFWDITPGGIDTVTDKGTGYYISSGIKFHFHKNVYVDAYLSRHQRNDIFADVSDYPVNIRESLVGLGVGFSF